MRLPLLSGKELIRILKRFGFVVVRQRGSHVFLRHEDGRTTLVAVHSGEKIDRGLLIKIIKSDLNMSVKEFLEKK